MELEEHCLVVSNSGNFEALAAECEEALRTGERDRLSLSRGIGMVAHLKKLFGREESPPLDIDKTVGRCLQSLPLCTAKVVVASPNYGDQHYRCEVIVDVDGLLLWAEHHAQSVWSSNQELQAARKALSLWLQGANRSDLAPSYVLPSFVAVLRPYAPNFVNQRIAHIVCPDCDRGIEDIERKGLNQQRTGAWLAWTDEWHCPKGHLLYREDHELHLYLGS